MEIDIYCKDKKCPICNNHMRHLRDDSLFCVNECYRVYCLESRAEINVFKSWFVFAYGDSAKIGFVKEKIEYWKENDRYLMEFLSR